MNLADARRVFGELPTVSVASLLADGSPHLVPLWFVWLEDAVFITARERSQVWANLVRDPRVALALDRGRGWTDLAGVMIRGWAELLPQDHPSLRRALSAWFEKYRGELSGRGFAGYTEQVHAPAVFRVRPDRIASWDHARRSFGPP